MSEEEKEVSEEEDVEEEGKSEEKSEESPEITTEEELAIEAEEESEEENEEAEEESQEIDEDIVKEGDFILVEMTGKAMETGEVFDTTDEEIAKAEDIHSDDRTYGPKLVAVGEGWVL